MIKKSKKNIGQQSYATKNDLGDVLKAVNQGFNLMEEQLQVMREEMKFMREDMNNMREDMNNMREDMNNMREDMNKQFNNVFTILDSQAKKSEGFEHERSFTFHAIERVEKELEKVKRHLHL